MSAAYSTNRDGNCLTASLHGSNTQVSFISHYNRVWYKNDLQWNLKSVFLESGIQSQPVNWYRKANARLYSLAWLLYNPIANYTQCPLYIFKLFVAPKLLYHDQLNTIVTFRDASVERRKLRFKTISSSRSQTGHTHAQNLNIEAIMDSSFGCVVITFGTYAIISTAGVAEWVPNSPFSQSLIPCHFHSLRGQQ